MTWVWQRLWGMRLDMKLCAIDYVSLVYFIVFFFLCSCADRPMQQNSKDVFFLSIFGPHQAKMGHLLERGWTLGSLCGVLLWVCHFPIDILGQVWYLIVSIPDICTLTYFGHVGTTTTQIRVFVFPQGWECDVYTSYNQILDSEDQVDF